MKEKITKFSRGNFEFELPKLMLSDKQITVTVEQGSSYYGCFTIASQDQLEIKGLVYSSNRLLRITDEQFCGVENIIRYKFRASGLHVNSEEKGIITCVTSMGEFEIPFCFHVVSPYCLIKKGEIKDLFQFTNLAKEDPAAALSLFKTDEFVNVFLKKEPVYRGLYDSLMKSISASQAMEEFLIAIHKKTPVMIDIDKSELYFEVDKNSFMEKLYITRNNWGYSEIKLYTDSPFIKLDHKVLWTDNFATNSYPLEVVLDPSQMRRGMNYGQIIVKTVYQEVIIPVTCKVPHKRQTDDDRAIRLRRYELQLTKNYLNFRMNKIDLSSYIQDTSDTLSSLTILEDDIYYDLARAHLYIISENHTMAEDMLASFGKRIEGNKNNAIAYCAYQYLTALYKKDKEVVDSAVETIREFYEKESDWRILWFLLYLDKKYDSNKVHKLRDIRKMCELGCKSPIMYFEACNTFNSNPALLQELGAFECAVLNWGAKESYLNKEIIVQYAYLAAREKTFSSVIYHTLVRLYEEHPMNDILYAICALLIKSEKTDNKYFEWYRLGVEAQLKLTSLHEYYMYAVDDDDENMSLSHPIYLYYMYNSNLSDNRKAFLYAQIIRNKEEDPSIYKTYVKQMERFMYRQLHARQINGNLAVIYNDLLLPEKVDETIAKDLSVLMYYNEITCYNPNIKGVCVVHKELENEIYHPLKDGKTVIPVFTENAQIFLVDNNDNRYYGTVPYNAQQLMDYSKYAEVCFVYEKENPLLLLHLSELALSYHKNAQDTILLLRLAIQIPNLQAWCYKKFLLALIKHYYDHYDGELLDAYLKEVDMKTLTESERIDMMEYMIIRDLSDKAIKALGRFGCASIPSNRLHKLCLKLVMSEPGRNEVLIYLCHELFKMEKYHDAILEYLVTYFQGTSKEMLAIWKEAYARNMEITSYEERLLGQILFTENHNVSVGDVFANYCKKGDNKILIRGFVTYYAYQYLLKDLEVEEALFPIMKKEIAVEENEFCTIALLKYYSTHETLTEEEAEFVDFQVNRLMKKGIVLPFFKDYKGKVALSEVLFNKYYVMYRTSKEKNVVIHYYMEHSDETAEPKEYVAEQMHEVFEGIYVKEFMLFSHEELLYYITEDGSEEEKAADSIEAGEVACISQDTDTKFDLINLMITSYHMQDEKTLLDTMKQYVTQDYIIEELLKPL
ncbi:DUF5717 family protein [Anaerosporobacter sp.]|uniref:DUF5717 family protein n=1 Tax=Anaerosporobacter sp. TaxID=1872529 RepID=UPI00286F3226|nr:DUF5717 family protein [Anaerosporobacter sp.]